MDKKIECCLKVTGAVSLGIGIYGLTRFLYSDVGTTVLETPNLAEQCAARLDKSIAGINEIASIRFPLEVRSEGSDTDTAVSDIKPPSVSDCRRSVQKSDFLGKVVGGIRDALTNAISGTAEDNLLLNEKLPEGVLLPEVTQTPGADGIPQLEETAAIPLGTLDGDPTRSLELNLNDDFMALVVGGTGAGKTTRFTYPTMGHVKDAIEFYVDVKGGEIADYWREVNHGSGKRLYLLSPYREGRGNCYVDPFQLLGCDPDNFVDLALELAATIMPDEAEVNNRIWSDSERAILKAFLIQSFLEGKGLTEALHRSTERTVAKSIADICENGSEAARQLLTMFCGLSDRIKSQLGLGMAATLPNFAVSPAMRRAFSASPGMELFDLTLFSANDAEPFAFILEVPEPLIRATQPIIRTVINLVLRFLEQRELRRYDGTDGAPAVCVLDEMNRIGRIPELINALNTLRARHTKLFFLCQSIDGLGTSYGESETQTLLTNFDYKVVMRVNDYKTQKYFSDLAGSRRVLRWNPSMSFSTSSGRGEEHTGFAISISPGRERVPLIQPHAFGRLRDEAVLFTPHKVVMIRPKPVYPSRRYGVAGPDDERPLQPSPAILTHPAADVRNSAENTAPPEENAATCPVENEFEQLAIPGIFNDRPPASKSSPRKRGSSKETRERNQLIGDMVCARFSWAKNIASGKEPAQDAALFRRLEQLLSTLPPCEDMT